MFPLTFFISFFITYEPMLIECFLNPKRKWLQKKINRLIRQIGWAALEMEFAQNQNNYVKSRHFLSIADYEHLIETRLFQLK